MNIEALTVVLSIVCLAGAAAHIAGSWAGYRSVGWLGKIWASTVFVLVALINGGSATAYGRMILIALMLSWLGDVLLLSMRKVFLLAGIAAFFFAHIAYAVAFAVHPLDRMRLFGGLALTLIFGLLMLRWLWRHLDQIQRVAVPIYLVAIAIMVSLAIAVSSPSLQLSVGIGAVAFAISDTSVARDRFVKHDILNRVWGLPLYYIAQLLIAASVASI